MAGSAANPPHLGHLQMVEELLKTNRFDLIYWLVSGSRNDKKMAHIADRMAMTDLTLPLSREDLVVKMGVYHFGFNIPTIEWLEWMQRLHPGWELTWITGQDPLLPQPKLRGRSEVETFWVRGEELLANWPVLVVRRSNFPDLKTNQAPKNAQIIDLGIMPFYSTFIRSLISRGKAFEHLVTGPVASYIKRNRLYGYREEGN